MEAIVIVRRRQPRCMSGSGRRVMVWSSNRRQRGRTDPLETHARGSRRVDRRSRGWLVVGR